VSAITEESPRESFELVDTRGDTKRSAVLLSSVHELNFPGFFEGYGGQTLIGKAVKEVATRSPRVRNAVNPHNIYIGHNYTAVTSVLLN
jgi:hypothetical protein